MPSHPATLVCKLRARTGPEIAPWVSSWQIRYHTKVIRFEGFVSADLLPPPHAKSNDWTLIVRFDTPEHLDRWLQSPERSWLAAETEPLLADGESFIETTAPDDRDSTPAGVTEIIRSEVLPGMEDDYRDWSRRTQHVQAQFPGYRGVHVLAPIPGQSNQWTTLLRFDTEENLDRWRHSPERATLIEEARAIISRTEITRLSTPFPGWVPLNPWTGENSAGWKTSLLVLIGVFPMVILAVRFVVPHLTALHPVLATLVTNTLTISTTTWVTMPFLVRKFAWWLYPGKGAAPYNDLRGGAIMAAIITVEAALLWSLF